MGDRVKEFLQDRLTALSSNDEEVLKAYMRKYGMPINDNPEVFWCAVHKARTALPSLPLELRLESKKWLDARGWQSFDDGELSQV